MAQSTQSPGKDKSKGVQWFKHFPTNFVRPYGPTVVCPSDETIWNRLQPFNCKLLEQPKVGISEQAASIEPNLNALLDNSYTMVDKEKIQALKDQMQPLIRALNPLEKSSGTEIESKHVVNMLKQFFKEDDEIDKLINEAFIVGSTLYTLALQFLVGRTVLRNPEQYARLRPMTTPGAKGFKENPSMKGMKTFLIDNVLVNNKASVCNTSCSSLLAQLDSSEDENVGATEKGLSASDDLSSQDEITKEKIFKKSKKRGKKRSQQSELVEEEEQPIEIPKKKKHKKKNI
jgi:hypothetical protein